MSIAKTELKIWAISLVFILVFIYGVYTVFKPDHFPMSFIRGEARVVSEQIIIGPYPTEREFQRLKAQGVGAIVSLMNGESPVESKLVDNEREMAEEMGMVFVNFPMGFADLKSDGNKVQMEKAVEFLLRHKGEKVYLHCYLGRHRAVMVAESLIKEMKMLKDLTKSTIPK